MLMLDFNLKLGHYISHIKLLRYVYAGLDTRI